MAKVKSNKAKGSKGKNHGTLITIILLTTLAATGIYFGVRYGVFQIKGSARTINLPTIDTKIKSGASGEEFYLTTDITLDFERSKNEAYNDIYNAVTEAVSGLDYDRVSTEDFSYIKNSIGEALSEIVSEDAGLSIYITNYQSSRDPIPKEHGGSGKATLPVIR